jgi:hypothetical protein
MVILRHIPTATLLQYNTVPQLPNGNFIGKMNDPMDSVNAVLWNWTKIANWPQDMFPVAVALDVPHRTRNAPEIRSRVKALGATFDAALMRFVINSQQWSSMSIDDRQSLFQDGLVSGLIVNEYIPWRLSARYPKLAAPTLVLRTCGYDQGKNDAFKRIGCKWNPHQSIWSWTPTAADVASGKMLSSIQTLNELMVIHYEVDTKTNEMLPNDYLDDTGKVACVSALQHDYNLLIANAIRSSFSQGEIMQSSGKTVHVMVTRNLPELRKTGIGRTDDMAMLAYGSKVATGDIGLKVHVFVPGEPDHRGDNIVTVYGIELCGNPNISTYGATLPKLRRKMLHLLPDTHDTLLSEFTLATKRLNDSLVLPIGHAREAWERRAVEGDVLEVRAMVMDPYWIDATISNGHFIPNAASAANANYAMTA